MKKILLALITIAVITSFCSAETTAQPESIFTGKVEKVTPTIYRSQTQPYCKILAAADNGEKSIFFVPKTASVTDAAGKDMYEGGKLGGLLLKKGQRIEVKYSVITNGSSITNGQNGAISIRCLD